MGAVEFPGNPDFMSEFEYAQAIEGGGHLDRRTGEAKRFINVGTLREKLSKIPREICPESSTGFIEYRLIVDPSKSLGLSLFKGRRVLVIVIRDIRIFILICVFCLAGYFRASPMGLDSMDLPVVIRQPMYYV